MTTKKSAAGSSAADSTAAGNTAEDLLPPQLKPADTSAWDEVDRRVRGRIAEVLSQAEEHYSSTPLGKLDSMDAIPAFTRTALAMASEPTLALQIGTNYATGMMRAMLAAGARTTGAKVDGPVKEGKDKRFADKTWSDNAGFWLLRQEYLLWEQALQELVAKAKVDDQTRLKVGFLTQAMVDALAPTNAFLANPDAMRKAVETGGQSVAKGVQNLLHDLATNGGQPQQFAEGVYEVGKNMAASPGKVVFRNDLMELIQYEPTTEKVHEIPLLFSPPWINKYYIMDLSPGRSLVQWAVDHGHTVFLISYRNPDETMRSVHMDDYLLSGPITALNVIRDITGQEKVNLLGLCLGGTLTMITLAYLDAIGDERINSAAFLNTLTDFSEPGALGVFTDEGTVAKLEVSMKKTGFLPAENMAKTFNLLRGNDLIWNYVVNNWMKGEDPPAFDLLSWNADSTRMPAEMHSFYLRTCYLENRLAKGELEIAGQKLNMHQVDQDLYFLAAEQDHIAPWRSSYIGARLPAGKVRFVLSNSGHIAGIVNPPHPKSKHFVGASDDLPENPDKWLETATSHPETWWEDWARWMEPRSGALVEPPPVGSETNPVLGEAPGTYVFGK
ncbi:PHA/PHB synthase family protein [Nakamurella sp. GG22]